MVADALREVMLAADGAGELAGDAVTTGAAEHPICGDVLELDCRVAEGRLVDLAWRATGCPATVAVAAAAFALRGQPIAKVEASLRSRLHALGGLHPTESHALALFLRAFDQAVGR